MTTKTTKTATEVGDETPQLPTIGTYNVDGDTLVATFGDRRRELSLRMSMRKMMAFTKKAKSLEEGASGDAFEVLEALGEFIPSELMDDEDLDYTEVLELFTQWSQHIGGRLGKALT